MNESMDPMRLMQRVTDRTCLLIPAADGAMVGLADARGVTYVCGAGHHLPSHVGTRVGLDSSLSGLVVRTGETLWSDDTATDPRVDGDACRALSVASAVCVPLTRAGETLGVLAVNASRPYAFTREDVATLAQLAEFVSVAIGSAHDLHRAGVNLLDLSRGLSGSLGVTSTEAVSRYVMGVLNPGTITEIEAGQRVRHALDNPERVSMVFQPIVDLTTDTVVAVEALARFNLAPTQPPDLWFRDARIAGLGVELEMLAVNAALAHRSLLPDGVALSVNAGPETVMSPAFHAVVNAARDAGVVIELTEHSMTDDYPALISAVQTLRRSSVRIATDDTGSGYSGLAHILKLAPDFIKLDRDLTTTIDLDPVRRALAASLVSFAADTGAEIIAEGVESRDELDVLRRIGVRYAQGFYLARPGPLGDALSYAPFKRSV